MESKEIAALYNHIRHKGGFRGNTRTDVSGMMFEASKRKVGASFIMTVFRVDCERPWGLEFVLKPYHRPFATTHPDDVTINLFKAIPDSINRFGATIMARMSHVEHHGDYEAEQHDCSLLRMFASEWGGDRA